MKPNELNKVIKLKDWTFYLDDNQLYLERNSNKYSFPVLEKSTRQLFDYAISLQEEKVEEIAK